MAETLHEMAVRMVKGDDCQPQCGKGCDKCPVGKLRSANGVCLVRRIAKVDNCEEQIEGLRAWAKEHPGRGIRAGRRRGRVCSLVQMIPALHSGLVKIAQKMWSVLNALKGR